MATGYCQTAIDTAGGAAAVFKAVGTLEETRRRAKWPARRYEAIRDSLVFQLVLVSDDRWSKQGHEAYRLVQV